MEFSDTLLAAILLVLITENTRHEYLGALVSSARALSITVTNWALGLLLTLRRRNWSNWLQLSVNAFMLVTVLWTFESRLMPTAEFFTAVSDESRYTVHVSPSRILGVANAFLFHGAVAPMVQQTSDFGIQDIVGPAWPMGLSFQNSLPGSASGWGVAAALVWCGVLALGAFAIFREYRALAWVVFAYICFEFSLHTVYGVETFMYELDWLPVLIIIAMYGFNRLRQARWPVCLIFIILLGVNNSHEFNRVCGILEGYQRSHPVSHPLKAADMIVRK
jgi:hypothetical protein